MCTIGKSADIIRRYNHFSTRVFFPKNAVHAVQSCRIDEILDGRTAKTAELAKRSPLKKINLSLPCDPMEPKDDDTRCCITAFTAFFTSYLVARKADATYDTDWTASLSNILQRILSVSMKSSNCVSFRGHCGGDLLCIGEAP